VTGCVVPLLVLLGCGLVWFILSALARLDALESKVTSLEGVVGRAAGDEADASAKLGRRLAALEGRVSRHVANARADSAALVPVLAPEPEPPPVPASAPESVPEPAPAVPAPPVTPPGAPADEPRAASPGAAQGEPPATPPAFEEGPIGPPVVVSVAADRGGEAALPIPEARPAEGIPVAAMEAAPPAIPVDVTPPPEPAPGPTPAAQPEPKPIAQPAPAFEPEPEPVEPAAAASGWSEDLRAGLAGEEWEAVVGGSWANKIGVGLTVIGVALGLGVSFSRMGPAGRVSLGVAISLGMLLTGVWVERRERYVVFARGLIGGGWASLYFTAYAMHGLEAARVIDSAITGTLLLAAVATGMIVHSLRYKSQVVTGLAYFLAFVALSLGGAPGFSLVALIPLAASLLMVTRWFSWAPMMLAGVGLTYGTYLVAASGAPNPTLADFARGEAVLAVYWLLFEVFDLFELGRGRTSPVTAAISPVNAFAFLGISMLQWEAMTPDTVYLLFGVTGAMYTASAIVRAWMRPPSSFGADSTVVQRTAAGGYELTITLATLLLAWGSMKRFDGLRLALALFMEAEMLFMVGRSLGQRYLRLLGTLLMLRPLAQIAIVAVSSDAVVATLGLQMPEWVPLASLFALAFYVNRASLRGQEPLAVERAYNGVASAIVLVVIRELAAPDWLAVAWFGVALVFHEGGARTRAGEFRLHAYVAVALSLAALFTTNIVTDPPRQWLVPSIVGALCYALTLRQVYGRHRAPDAERVATRIACAIPGSVLAAIVCWMIVPEDRLGVAWMVLALVLHEVGADTRAGDFRWHSYIAAALGVVGVFSTNIFTDPPRQWGMPVIAGVLSYAFALRQVYGPHRASDDERGSVRTAMAIPGSLLAGVVCWMLVPESQLGPWWMALSLAFYEVAARTRGADLRFHAYAAAAAGLGWVAVTNLPDGPGGNWLVPAAAALIGYALAARQVYGPNRIAEAERRVVRTALTMASGAMMAAVFWIGLPDPWFRLAWVIFATVLFELGAAAAWTDLKIEAYVLGALGVLSIAVFDASAGTPPAWSAWVNMAGATVLLTAWYLRLTRWPPRQLAERTEERDGVRHVCSGAALYFMGAMVWHAGSASFVAVGWALAALVAIEAGVALRDGILRGQGHVMLTVALIRLAGVNFIVADTWHGISVRVLTVLPVIGAYAFQSARLRQTAGLSTPLERFLVRWYPWVPASLAAALVSYEARPEFVAPGWIVLAVALLLFGLRRRIDEYRVQAYLLSVAAVGVCWATNFNEPGWHESTAAGIVVIALCFAAQLVSLKPGAPPLTASALVGWLDRHARMGYALLGTALLTVLLYCEASARALTVAWSIEAAAILVFGFIAHERALRLSGLVLLAVCIAKLVFMDFRGLDAVWRSVSFIVLGVLSVAASWVYTRYREQLHRYL